MTSRNPDRDQAIVLMHEQHDLAGDCRGGWLVA